MVSSSINTLWRATYTTFILLFIENIYLFVYAKIVPQFSTVFWYFCLPFHGLCKTILKWTETELQWILDFANVAIKNFWKHAKKLNNGNLYSILHYSFCSSVATKMMNRIKIGVHLKYGKNENILESHHHWTIGKIVKRTRRSF